MPERQLVTIRTVSHLLPIPGADSIESAVVDGWTCVVKKEIFNIGDQAVYFEIDSLLPLADERFSFLKKGAIGQEFHRLRTMRLRKQLSQGLLLPISEFPELAGKDDLAQALGIIKWEPQLPACLTGKVKGVFPSFIRKTDEERIQNMPSVLVDEADSEFEVTIKLDGSSMTAFFKDGEIGICSRNLHLFESEDNTLWQVAKKIGVLDALSKLGRNIAIQGELMGPGIQGNRESLKEHQWFVFNIFNIDSGSYMGCFDRLAFEDELSRAGCHVDTVPFIGIRKLSEFSDVNSVLRFADGSSLNHKIREGIVFKRMDGGLSFKAISNVFLLSENNSCNL